MYQIFTSALKSLSIIFKSVFVAFKAIFFAIKSIILFLKGCVLLTKCSCSAMKFVYDDWKQPKIEII